MAGQRPEYAHVPAAALPGRVGVVDLDAAEHYHRRAGTGRPVRQTAVQQPFTDVPHWLAYPWGCADEASQRRMVADGRVDTPSPTSTSYTTGSAHHSRDRRWAPGAVVIGAVVPAVAPPGPVQRVSSAVGNPP